mmetsp:Transcript_71734/g.191393  ORF Transcript_71734/g.191393 Transcript_71734/m.191393 type:complete len:283 (-) Transcript_71734:447-1295(-)
MPYVQKCRLTFHGIDDELKDDETSIYTTNLNSINFPVPVAIAPGAAPVYENQQYGVQAVDFNIRKNTKLMRFSLKGTLNNISLSNKSKLIIESIAIPNILSNTFKQSKCVNNIQLRLRGLPNNNIYYSTTKGRGATNIFSCPIFLNTQGYGETNSVILPDRIALSQRPRINADNNGHLFINTCPERLYNFDFDESFLKNGIFEFELLYDVGNVINNGTADGQFLYVPQTLIFDQDRDDLEQFMISLIIVDYDDSEEKMFNETLLSKINITDRTQGLKISFQK